MVSTLTNSLLNSCQFKVITTNSSLKELRFRISRVSASAEINSVGEPTLVNLGQSPLQVSRLGIGTLQWGDPSSGFGERFSEIDIRNSFEVLVDGGINFFDTAEVYGYQNIKNGSSSEQIIGKLAASKSSTPNSIVVGTKFFTIPWTKFLIGGGWRFGTSSMIPALRESLQRLGKSEIDLWQIHFPFPTISNSALVAGLKEAMDLGLTKAVGVSNYGVKEMEEAHRLLKSSNIPLASNQVKYNLLCRDVESNGLLKATQDLGISLIAYSPLGSGVLSEKTLSRTDSASIKVRPLLTLMASIGEKNGGKTISQVALNYLVCKGAIPIPGCKTREQAIQHLGVLDWKLSSTEVEELEDMADRVQ